MERPSSTRRRRVRRGRAVRDGPQHVGVAGARRDAARHEVHPTAAHVADELRQCRARHPPAEAAHREELRPVSKMSSLDSAEVSLVTTLTDAGPWLPPAPLRARRRPQGLGGVLLRVERGRLVRRVEGPEAGDDHGPRRPGRAQEERDGRSATPAATTRGARREEGPREDHDRGQRRAACWPTPTAAPRRRRGAGRGRRRCRPPRCPAPPPGGAAAGGAARPGPGPCHRGRRSAARRQPGSTS